MRIFVYEHLCAGGLGPDVADSLRHEGRAMLDAIVADFRRLPGIEVVTLLDQAERFGELAASCAWTLVIAPEFDDLLRSLSQTVLDVGGRLLGSMPAAIRLTGDKLETGRFWHQRGVPHPRTRPVRARPSPSWVLKPRHGAGAQATYLIGASEDREHVWQRACKEWPSGDFIEQEYVAGLDASVALLVGTTQMIPLLPARQLVSTTGQFRYLGGWLPLPEPLASRVIKLALQAVAGINGLRGYVGVDLIVGDHGDYAIEINPRLTTSYLGLRQLCKQNLAELILCLAQGASITPLSWHAGEVHFSTDV